MGKLIKFPIELVAKIQNYANHNHNGNFTRAVIDLCEQALGE